MDTRKDMIVILEMAFKETLHNWVPFSHNMTVTWTEQRPVTRSFGVSFELHPNKRLNKQ